MSTSTKWLAVVPLALALVACGGGDEEVEQDAGMTSDSARMAETGVPPAAATGQGAPAPVGADTAGAGHGSTVVELDPVGNSGVSGTASIVDLGMQNGTQVVVQLAAGRGPGSHAAHVHQGTCAQLGPVAHPLQSISVDATGNGNRINNMSIPVMTLMDGQHVVSVHEQNGDPGAPVACGAIPGHPM